MSWPNPIHTVPLLSAESVPHWHVLDNGVHHRAPMLGIRGVGSDEATTSDMPHQPHTKQHNNHDNQNGNPTHNQPPLRLCLRCSHTSQNWPA
jgi:hypothetical protein